MTDDDMMMRCEADQHNDTPLPALYQIVDEAMTYLDPPSHESLTLESVAHAYTILQQAAAATCQQQKQQEHECHYHPRVQQLVSILNRNDSISTNYNNNDWILQQADLYRALLLASFLWLELQGDNDKVAAATTTPTTTISTMQNSVERCLLLLRALSNNFYNNNLPQSRHSLLQAVLEEPLVPLNKHERHYTYLLQRTKDCVDDENDNQNDDIDLFSGMNKRQLMREEQELLQLASKEIPMNDNSIDDIPPPSNHVPQEAWTVESGIAHEGPLVWIVKDDDKNDRNQMSNVQVYSCGVLVVSYTEESQQRQDNMWYLLPTASVTTRQVEMSLHLVITGACCCCCSITATIQQSSIEFQVDSLLRAHGWVTSLQQVIQDLNASVTLQQELRQEWKQEYEQELAKQSSLLATRMIETCRETS